MRRALVLAAALSLAACSPAYVFKAWRGHRAVMSKRRPIERVLADPAASPAVKSQLALVAEIRRFGAEKLGLPETKNYRDYVDVGRPQVSWVVTASPKTRFEARTWWFPVVGRVPYKGYFDEQEALAEAAKLAARGLDAHVGGVRAFSTLRWFKDPVLSTMLAGGPGGLAETLLHEMTHGALYFPGQGDFDESAATFLGETGARSFIRARFGVRSAEALGLDDDLESEAAFSAMAAGFYERLDALYRSTAADAEKLKAREPILAEAAQALGLPIVDNAVLLGVRRYRGGRPDLAALHERCGSDPKRTLAALKRLDRRDPAGALKKAIIAPCPPETTSRP